MNSFWATVCNTIRPMLSDRCLFCPVCLSVCLSVCDIQPVVKPVVKRFWQPVWQPCWTNSCYLLDLNWCRAITQCTHPVNVLTTKLWIKIFRKRIPCERRRVAFLQLCQTVGWMKMPLGKEVGLGPGHIVLDGTQWGPSPHSSPSPLSAHAYCGQTNKLLSSCNSWGDLRSCISITVAIYTRLCRFLEIYMQLDLTSWFLK